jgi:YD repeat-containing protein
LGTPYLFIDFYPKFSTLSWSRLTEDDPIRRVSAPDGTLRQILAPESFVHVSHVTESGYTLSFYPREAAGPKDEQGYYTINGSPDAVWTVAGGNNTLTIANAGENKTFVYTQEDDHTLALTVNHAETLRQSVIENPDERIVTRTVEDAAGRIGSTLRTTLKKLPRGLSMTSSVADPDGAALTTVQAWHNDPTAPGEYGRLRSEIHPDGSWTRFYYDDSGRTARTVHARLAASPSGLAYKTTRDIRITDGSGRPLMEASEVYTGSDYARLQWTVHTLDDKGRVIHTQRSDGTETRNTWGCCNRTSAVDPRGMTTGFTHDALNRLTSTTRPVPSGMITTSYTYDAGGRRLSETVAAGGLTLTSSNVFDSAGRLTGSTDPSGLTTIYDYSADNRTTTITRPGGAVEITGRYRDGRVKRISGAGTIERYYEYGVNSDGTRWTLVYTGGQDAALWEKTTTDVLGRTLREERPAFDGTVAVTTHEYDVLGRLVKTRSPGRADIFYIYDALGNPVMTGLDVDNSGDLEPASMDRITRTETSYVNLNGDWWQQSEQQVFGADNTDLAKTTGATRTRLTGLGINGMVHESVSIDLFGHPTVSTTYIDPATRTETRTIAYPDSEINAHRLQDYWTHYAKDYRWYPFHGWEPRHWGFGHMFAGKEPDDDTDAWEVANAETEAWVNSWMDRCCLCGDQWIVCAAEE